MTTKKACISTKFTSTTKNSYKILLTFLQALVGGTVFYVLNLPLPWTLGPLAVILVLQLGFNKVVYWPAVLRKGALVVLGITMGSPFTMTTARQIVEQLPVMLAATAATIAVSLFMGYITHKRTGVDLASGLLGSVPGGLSQMAVLSKELNADATVVTFMQTLRLLAVVFTVPFLARHGLAEVVDTAIQRTAAQSTMEPGTEIFFVTAVLIGSLAAQRIGLPTPWMLGPTLVTAALVCSGLEPLPMPTWLITVAQVSTGIYMGANIKAESMSNWKTLLPYTVSGIVGILLCSFAIGFILKALYGYSLVTAFLGTAPGGVAEMGLTAMMVHADLSVVISYQMFRLLFILLVVPIALKWMLKKM